MPQNFRLLIPEEDLESFLKLSRLDGAQLEAVASGLERAVPSLKRDELIQQLREDLLLQDFRFLREVLQSIITLSGTYREGGFTPAEAVDAAFGEFEPQQLERFNLLPLEETKALVTRMISAPTIRIIRGAINSNRRRKQILQGVEIDTKVSPIFLPSTERSDAVTILRAALISHAMTLHVSSARGHRNIKVSLDPEDFGAIVDALGRAAREERAVRQSLEGTGVTIVGSAPFSEES